MAGQESLELSPEPHADHSPVFHSGWIGGGTIIIYHFAQMYDPSSLIQDEIILGLTLQAPELHSSSAEGLIKESQRYSGTVSRVSVCLHTTDRVLKI